MPKIIVWEMKNTIRTFNLKMPDGSCRDGREYINLRRNGERLTVVGRAKEIGEKNAGDRLLGDDLRAFVMKATRIK